MPMPNTLLDLRNLTIDQVVQLVTKNNMQGGTESTDITHLYPSLVDKYRQVVCVWLKNIWKLEDHKIVHKGGEKFDFILWNGRHRAQRNDCDLHGFVLTDGSVEWCQVRTMNLMR